MDSRNVKPRKSIFIFFRHRVHRECNELGREGLERRRHFPYFGLRRSVSDGVPKNLQAYLQALIPCLRHHIYTALSYYGEPRGKNHRKTFMHLIDNIAPESELKPQKTVIDTLLITRSPPFLSCKTGGCPLEYHFQAFPVLLL